MFQCVAISGLGFRRGSYRCVCKRGFYYPDTKSTKRYYNGTVIEEEYEKLMMVNFYRNRDFPHYNFRLYFLYKGNFRFLFFALGSRKSVLCYRSFWMSALCRGLWILRGRFTLRSIPQLVDANCYFNTGVLCNSMPTSSCLFYVEIWQC